MDNSENYKIKLENFHQVVGKSFYNFWKNKKYCDVTIRAEGKQIPAHRMILAACSPFLEQMVDLSDLQLINLAGTKYNDVIAVLELAYKGEVDVAHQTFESFQRTATELQIKGIKINGEPIKLPAAKKFPKPIEVKSDTSVGEVVQKTQESSNANEEPKVPASKRRRETIPMNWKAKKPGKASNWKTFLFINKFFIFAPSAEPSTTKNRKVQLEEPSKLPDRTLASGNCSMKVVKSSVARCQFCSKKYTKQYLCIHVKVCRLNPDRIILKCAVCQKELSNEYTLERHVMQHKV